MSIGTAPETNYVRARDGHHLAWQVTGDGDRDVIFIAGELTPIDLIWDDPLAALALHRLAGSRRLILGDLRGWGSSDSVPSTRLPAMQAWTDDIETVLDAAGSERADLVAASETCLPAMLFAAAHPERVSSLVLINPFARFLRGPETPWGLPEESGEKYVKSYRELTASGGLVDWLAPSRAGDPVFRHWFSRSTRLGGGPGEAAAVYRLFMKTDITGVLPSVQAPTLVVRRRDDHHVRGGHAELVADRIPDSQYVELEGDDNLWLSGDVEGLFDEIETFLTGARGPSAGNRVLSTVLFTDIVESTEMASSMGDAAWAKLLAAHDEMIESHVAAFRGRVVKSTGDGALAVFDGPARAIQCAKALSIAVRTLGLEIRAGIHSGEVEVMGDDLGGVAVHLGSRVAAMADASEVLVSGSVPALVAGSGLTFEPKGEHYLKGFEERWPLLTVE